MRVLKAAIKRLGRLSALWSLTATVAHAQVIAPTGTVTTIGGYGAGYADGDNSVSQFNDPWGLTVDSNGKVIIADRNNNAIRMLDPEGDIASTLLTSSVVTSGGQRLNSPAAVIYDGSGHLLIANSGGNNVLRWRTEGVLDVFATGLLTPVALAIDFEGRVYVATQPGLIRQFERNGLPGIDFVVPARHTPSIQGVAVRSDGSVIVSDAFNHVLWRFPAGGAAEPSIFAGRQRVAGFANGTAENSRFNSPHQIAPASNNAIIIADRGNHRVRMIDFNGTTSTIYGADPAQWQGSPFLPGWQDGPVAEAWARDPVGVVATSEGIVYTSEIVWDIIRETIGVTFPSNSNGGGTPPLPGAERNKISLGFASGEGSALFVGLPGQYYIAPITLSLVPEQKMYGLQFNFLMKPNAAGTPNQNFMPEFQSHLMAPSADGFFYPIDPAFYTHTLAEIVDADPGPGVILRTNFYPQFRSLVLTNDVGNFLGVAWLERFGMTNLYNTRSQDLITYSAAHDTLFPSSGGKVIVGSAGFRIPLSARPPHNYEISVGRPSANSDGVAADVFIEAPDNRVAGPASLSAVRILSITNSVPNPDEVRYLVGDVAPFQWFNSGEFGDGSILNNDLAQIHQSLFDPTLTAAFPFFIYSRGYNLNVPPRLSDMFGAMDSCCLDINRNVVTGRLEDRTVMDRIVYGDGILTYQDVLVTMRRALDPSVTNYYRVWRANPRAPGYPDIEGASNLFRGALSASIRVAPSPDAKKFPLNEAMAELPSNVRIYVDPVRVRPGQTIQVPIKAEITGVTPVRTIILQVAVRTLDGGALAAPVTITPNPELGTVFANYARGPLDCGIGWLNTLPDIPAGTVSLGTINLAIPASATADAIFDIKFMKSEAGMDLTAIPSATEDAVIVMENRAAAPWSDEIPDTWRVQHFGSLMNILSAPDADADGDGMTTLDEFRAGTIPTDLASRLALQGRALRSQFVVSWPSAFGKFYRLESSTALTGQSWTLLEDRIPGTGGQIERAPAVENPDARFYRVQVVE